MIRQLEDELREYDQLKSGELPDHALVASEDRGGAFAWLLLFRRCECSPEAFDLRQCAVSLRVALDHARTAFTT